MNKINKLLLLALVAALAIVLAACTIGGAPDAGGPPGGVEVGGSRPTARPTRPAATIVPPGVFPTIVAGATSAPVGTVETRSVKKLSSGLEKLKSYRARLGLVFDGADKNGTPLKSTLDYLQETHNEPSDQHIRVAGSGDMSGVFGLSAGAGVSAAAAVETYRANNNTFLVQNGKCQFVGSGTTTTGGSALFSPDEFIGSLDKLVLVSRGETVNGVTADHYQFNDTVLTGSSVAGMKMSQGDLWLTADGYVVKVSGKAAGKTKQGADGALALSYDVDTINQLSALKVPADCVVPVLAGDVPLPSNATDKKVTTSAGTTLTTFKSADDVKTVSDFFRQALPAQGWKLETDKTLNPAAIALSFTKDGGKRTLNVNVLVQSGSTSVIMTDKTAS